VGTAHGWGGENRRVLLRRRLKKLGGGKNSDFIQVPIGPGGRTGRNGVSVREQKSFSGSKSTRCAQGDAKAEGGFREIGIRR